MDKNIVTDWAMFQNETNGLNQTQALQNLNAQLGTNYSPHRLSEWKKERRSLPTPVANYMLNAAVEHVVRHPSDIGLIRLPIPKRT